MSEEEDRKAAVRAEIERISKIDPEQWDRAVETVKEREKAERLRLFGDREPFAVPDVEADS
jgi:hypothetical protein